MDCSVKNHNLWQHKYKMYNKVYEQQRPAFSGVLPYISLTYYSHHSPTIPAAIKATNVNFDVARYLLAVS